MLRAVILSCLLGLFLVSAGLLVWQTDFAEAEKTSRYQPPPKSPDHPGVPQTISDRTPFVARVLASIQDWMQPEPTLAEKPTVNRGGFSNRQGFDIRYSKRPGD